MSKNLKNHYKNVLIYNILTKFHYKNVFEIPKITKICLNIGLKNANFEKKKLINILILLKLITNQQPTTTKSKKNNIFLKIKKNSIIGCKITLHKNNIYYFLEKILFFIIPNTKDINFNKKDKNIINFQIKNILDFFELQTEFLKFQKIPNIDVTIHTNSENNLELYSLLNSFFLIKSENSSIGRV